MGLCGEAMGASKINLRCEVCYLDGITTKSSLKRHQRYYCKGAAGVVQQPLTTDVKVVTVSEKEVIVTTEKGKKERSSSYCVQCALLPRLPQCQ